jgi:hypothetical protein
MAYVITVQMLEISREINAGMDKEINTGMVRAADAVIAAGAKTCVTIFQPKIYTL